MNLKNRDVFDVCIIGGGVIGTLIARELSKYDVSICLMEKGSDVAVGATCANSGIVHGGYADKPGTKKARFCARGNRLYRKLNDELQFGLKEIGSLAVGLGEDERCKIQELLENGKKNGIAGLNLLEGDAVRKLEPHLSESVVCALRCTNAAIISPYEVAIAAMENAIDNGTRLFLNSEVYEIQTREDFFIVKYTDNEFQSTHGSELTLQAKYVINAAGLHVDKIVKLIRPAETSDDQKFSENLNDYIKENKIEIKPRQGQYLLLDKDQGNLANSIIFQSPSLISKGILVTNTYHGNLLIGPDAEHVDDVENVDTTKARLDKVVESAKKILPSFDLRKVITNFAGNRASTDRGDFFIERMSMVATSSNIKNFINVMGIESPGLTSAPAIAEHVVEIMKDSIEKPMKLKGNFKNIRERYLDFGARAVTATKGSKSVEEEIKNIVTANPLYGKIVCRCESVTEGEIVYLLRNSKIPIRTVDALKRRLRVGMGRCQGGFCLTRIIEIMHRELNIPVTSITKKGLGSEFVLRDVGENV